MTNGINEHPKGWSLLFFVDDLYAENVIIWTTEITCASRTFEIKNPIRIHSTEWPAWAIFLIETDKLLACLAGNAEYPGVPTTIGSISITLEWHCFSHSSAIALFVVYWHEFGLRGLFGELLVERPER